MIWVWVRIVALIIVIHTLFRFLFIFPFRKVCFKKLHFRASTLLFDHSWDFSFAFLRLTLAALSWPWLLQVLNPPLSVLSLKLPCEREHFRYVATSSFSVKNLLAVFIEELVLVCQTYWDVSFSAHFETLALARQLLITNVDAFKSTVSSFQGYSLRMPYPLLIEKILVILFK